MCGIFEDTQFSELKWEPVSHDIRGLWAGEGPHTSEEVTFISGPGRCPEFGEKRHRSGVFLVGFYFCSLEDNKLEGSSSFRGS